MPRHPVTYMHCKPRSSCLLLTHIGRRRLHALLSHSGRYYWHSFPLEGTAWQAYRDPACPRHQSPAPGQARLFTPLNCTTSASARERSACSAEASSMRFCALKGRL